MKAIEAHTRFADPDEAYRAIIEAHRGLTDEESATLNAALVLTLAHQLGDIIALREALDVARVVLNGSPINGNAGPASK
jgi:hypothetical protein